MEENKNNEKLFDLISNKSFDMLNDEERKLVLAEMMEEEYRSMYDLQRNMAGAMKEEIFSASDAVKDRILSSYDKKYETGQQKRGSILFMKVPLYQVAAAVVLAIVMTGMAFYLGGATIKPQPQIVYQQKRDTIFVNSNEVKKEVSTASIAMDSMPTGHYSQSGKMDNKANPNSAKEQITDDCHLCHSIKKDYDLKQFMVSSI